MIPENAGYIRSIPLSFLFLKGEVQCENLLLCNKAGCLMEIISIHSFME